MLKSIYKWWIRLRSSSLELKKLGRDEFAYSEWEFAEGKRTWQRFFAGRIDLTGKRIIDLGCGLGGKTAYYATLGPSAIVGIDILEKNITKAENFAHKKEITANLDFKCASATELPFDDKSFDIALSNDSFEHYPDPEGVLKETARIIKPAGLFAIDFAQWGTPKGHHLQRWIKAPWAHLFLKTDEILTVTREMGEKQIAKIEDHQWREELSQKLEWDIEHHRDCLNRISIRDFEILLSESDVWTIKHKRHTAASPWLFPLKAIPFLREYVVGRNVYILEGKP